MRKSRKSENATVAPKDLLARVFLEHLARSEEVESNHLLYPDPDADDWLDVLDDLKSPDDTKISLRSDKAAVAVLLARTLEGDRTLLRALKRGAPVVALTVPQADTIDLVSDIFRTCALPPSCEVVRTVERRHSGRKAYFVTRDGFSKDHRPDSGNSGVAAALNARMTIVGIAPNPATHLPRDLMRSAEFKIGLPTLDASAIALVIEAVTGKRPSRSLTADFARLVDIADLSLAFRSDRTADECLERLETLVNSKQQFWAAGPALEDLWGYGEAKVWGLTLAEDLRDLKSGRVTWDVIDGKSALLAGPPGVGKTSFARALAKTCCVPLVEASVAQWNSAGHLGNTLQAMRETFTRARRMAPCILFIDELDGISSREKLSGDYVEYWLQIVNLLLELMSSPEGREGVVLVGATNFPDKIDPALRRSGRLDRQFDIALPGLEDLAKILRFQLGADLADIELTSLAGFAQGMTGADLEGIVRRARGRARRQRRDLEVMDLLVELHPLHSIQSKEVQHRAAVHESGHAVACARIDAFAVEAAVLTARGGHVIGRLSETVNTKAGILDTLVVLAAGREAEIELLGHASVGAGMKPESDLALATDLAMSLELRSGLGETGPVYIEGTVREAAVYSSILPIVTDYLTKAAERARILVRKDRRAVEAVAAELAERGYLSAPRIRDIIEKNPPIAQIVELADAG